MGVFDWIHDSMVRKFGQTSRDRAIQLAVVKEQTCDPGHFPVTITNQLGGCP